MLEQEKLIETISRSKEGDAEAQERLILDIQDSVYYHCKKILKKEEDAQDAAQDVLITVLTSLEKLREPAAFYGWVNGITANRCRHLLSRGPQEWQIPEDEDGNSMLDSMETLDEQLVPDKALDNEETSRLVLELIDALPAQQRMCVLFYYYDEMSVKEIAEAMDVSEGTVKSRLNYARKSIKNGVERLDKEGTKLYGLSPLPFLLFFLRKAAEAETLPVEAGKAMLVKTLAAVHGVGAVGAAGSAGAATAGSSVGGSVTGAAGTTGATGAAGAAGVTGAAGASGGAVSAGLLGTMAAKVVAGVLAVALLAGGVTVGLKSRNNEPRHNDRREESVPAVVILDQTQADPSGEGDFNYLMALPYTGSITDCKMSDAQAAAFAEILETAAARNGSNDFARAAFFDAGDGIPAMMVVTGSDMSYGNSSGYMAEYTSIYTWNGTEAVRVDLGSVNNYYLTSDGLVLDDFGPVVGVRWNGSYESSELYALENGQIGSEPAQIYEHFAFSQDECPTVEQVQTRVESSGEWTAGYDYNTYAQSQVMGPLCDSGDSSGKPDIWTVCALNGKFVSYEEACQDETALIWTAQKWLLGHGQAGAQDASWNWRGKWMDAGEAASILRGENTAPPRWKDIPLALIWGKEFAVKDCTYDDVTASYDERTRLFRVSTVLQEMEVYYEFPVLTEDTEGKQKLNAMVQEGCTAFFSETERIENAVNRNLSIYQQSKDDSLKNACYEKYWITEETDSYVSLCWEQYQGGAWGASGYASHVYDAESGKQLYMTDLLAESEEEIWRELLLNASEQSDGALSEEKLSGWLHSRYEDLTEIPFYVENRKIKIDIQYSKVELTVELPITAKPYAHATATK